MKDFFLSLCLSLFISSLLFGQDFSSLNPNHYAVVIGVGEFQDSKIPNADYADRDAQAFTNFLLSENGGNLPKENIRLLVNEKATVAAIYTSLDWLISESEKGDQVYIYYSGYGDIDGAFERQYIYAFDTPSQNLRVSALAAQDLNDLVSTLSTRNEAEVFLIMDIDGVNQSSINNSVSLEDIKSRNSNEFRLFAAERNHKAYASADLGGGHGLFTYFLIRGLLGAADTDQDMAISLYELKIYVQEKVSKYAKTELNVYQNPVIKGTRSKVLSYTEGDFEKDEEQYEKFFLPSKETQKMIEEGSDTLSTKPSSGSRDSYLPQFQIANINFCAGQALITDTDSFTVEIQLENEVENLMVNKEKLSNPKPGLHQLTVPLNSGLNLIKVSAQNKFKSKIDSVYVYTDYDELWQLSNAFDINHHALFIATDSFDHFSQLANPVLDARAISSELGKNYGFNIDTLINPSADEILLKLNEYTRQFPYNTHLEKNDHLLIYISSHGILDKESALGYLVTKESKADDPIFRSYLSWADLQSRINKLGFKHILVMIDACYGGTFDQNLLADEIRAGSPYDKPSDHVYIEGKLKLRTRKYIASGGAVPVSDGLKGTYSPFTKLVLEALRNPSKNIIAIEDLMPTLNQNRTIIQSRKFSDQDEPGSNFLFLRKRKAN